MANSKTPQSKKSNASDQPNILVIWGDDIGVHNISVYNHGLMGYRTPNIDRIAKEGALFTDAYAQQSCTAGRASFILGQHRFCIVGARYPYQQLIWNQYGGLTTTYCDPWG